MRLAVQLGAHVREDGEDAAVVVLARGKVQLVEDHAHVFLDGVLGDDEPLADRLVRAALGDQLEHLALARRQRSERARFRVCQQPRDDLRIEGGAAARDPTHRAGEVRRVGHAVLEQVAEMLRGLGQQLGCDAHVDVLGEEHDPHPGMASADLVRGLNPLVGLRRRHADVDDRHVRLVRVDGGEQLLRARGLGDDLDALAPHERRDALAQQPAVVGDHDSHGSSAVTTVPAPGGLRMRNVPSSAATRSASPWSPVPADSSAPPMPSSAISMTATPPRRETRTDACVAWAYLAKLASASQATKYAASSTGWGRRSVLWKETVVGTLAREASESSAAFRPWLSTAGWIPRASSRNSSSDCESSSLADVSNSSATAGLVRTRPWIMRSCSATETSRCWAPSWRLRSSRRRSASPAATMRSREARSSASRPSDSACSRASSRAIAAAAATAPTSSGSSSSDASWISIASSWPSRSTGAAAQWSPGTGSATGCPRPSM